jgi:acetate kinase
VRTLVVNAGSSSLKLAAAGDEDARLGLEVDLHRLRSGIATGDQDLSAPGATVQTLVVRAREDVEIARQVRGVLSSL